jgi:hypothetical protein
MKGWNSAFNAQGSRGIIVAVQVGAVKIYVALVEALRKNERQGETQKTVQMFFLVSPCRIKERPICVILKPQWTDGFHESTCQQQFEG